MRQFSLLILMTTHTLFAAPLFDVARDCVPVFPFEPNPQLYWNCQSISTQLEPTGVSETDQSFLKAIRPRNELRVRYQCQSSQVFSAEFRFQHSFVSLAPNIEVQSLERIVPSEGSSWEIKVSPKRTSTVKPGCQLEILSNLSIVPAETLSAYADLLLKRLEQNNGMQGALLSAVALPEKWVVARSLPEEFSTQLTQLDQSRQTKAAELVSLQAVPPEQRTTRDRERLQSLPAEIEDLELQAFHITFLKEQIEEALPETYPCGPDGEPSVFCLEKLQSVESHLLQSQESLRDEAAHLVFFLEKEIVRLQVHAQAIGQRLSEVITKINEALGGRT